MNREAQLATTRGNRTSSPLTSSASAGLRIVPRGDDRSSSATTSPRLDQVRRLCVPGSSIKPGLWSGVHCICRRSWGSETFSGVLWDIEILWELENRGRIPPQRCLTVHRGYGMDWTMLIVVIIAANGPRAQFSARSTTARPWPWRGVRQNAAGRSVQWQRTIVGDRLPSKEG